VSWFEAKKHHVKKTNNGRLLGMDPRGWHHGLLSRNSRFFSDILRVCSLEVFGGENLDKTLTLSLNDSSCFFTIPSQIFITFSLHSCRAHQVGHGLESGGLYSRKRKKSVSSLHMNKNNRCFRKQELHFIILFRIE